MKQQYNLPCNIAQALNIIGDKWTLLIINQIMRGRDTYSSILEKLEGIPSNLLSKRLKCLEEEKIVETILYQKHPPRYRYVLTESGEDLSTVLYSIIMWGNKHLRECHKTLIHKDCDHKVDVQYFCSDCNKIVEKEEIAVK
jgi:DNA-binding HxlR family transcriptional regulator